MDLMVALPTSCTALGVTSATSAQTAGAVTATIVGSAAAGEGASPTSFGEMLANCALGLAGNAGAQPTDVMVRTGTGEPAAETLGGDPLADSDSPIDASDALVAVLGSLLPALPAPIRQSVRSAEQPSDDVTAAAAPDAPTLAATADAPALTSSAIAASAISSQSPSDVANDEIGDAKLPTPTPDDPPTGLTETATASGAAAAVGVAGVADPRAAVDSGPTPAAAAPDGPGATDPDEPVAVIRSESAEHHARIEHRDDHPHGHGHPDEHGHDTLERLERRPQHRALTDSHATRERDRHLGADQSSASIRRLGTEPTALSEDLDQTNPAPLAAPKETPTVTRLDLDDASPDLAATAGSAAADATTDVGPDVDALVRPAASEPLSTPATLAATPAMASSPRGGADHVSRPEELPRVVVHQLGDLAHDGSNRRIVLRLDPPDLGEVILEIRHRNDDVSVVMRADNADAVRALNREHAEVQRAIQSLGFELGEFDVSARNGDPGRHRQGDTRSARRGTLFSPAPHLDQPTGAREGVLLL